MTNKSQYPNDKKLLILFNMVALATTLMQDKNRVSEAKENYGI